MNRLSDHGAPTVLAVERGQPFFVTDVERYNPVYSPGVPHPHTPPAVAASNFLGMPVTLAALGEAAARRAMPSMFPNWPRLPSAAIAAAVQFAYEHVGRMGLRVEDISVLNAIISALIRTLKPSAK
jgi:hypothetical protein